MSASPRRWTDVAGGVGMLAFPLSVPFYLHAGLPGWVPVISAVCATLWLPVIVRD